MDALNSAPEVEIEDAAPEDAAPLETQDRWFDQWINAKGEPLKDLVSSMMGGLAAYERAGKTRKRQRKQEDKLRYETCVEVLVCNLAYAVLNPPTSGRIAFRRSKRFKTTRYDNRILSPKVLIPILDRMADMQTITQEIGKASKGRLSTIAPTEWFARRTHERQVSLGDFGRSEHEEVVILTLKSKWLTEFGLTTTQTTVDYPDSSDTNEIRHEVQLLNRFLERADLDFIDDGHAPTIDPYQRTMTRRFTLRPRQSVRFDQSGRLFGPWWMTLKKNRRRNIRIQGEPAAELDFSNMFARLAYARIDSEPPEGDLYDLSGHLDGYEPHHRKGVKLAFNTLLFSKGSRFPEGFGKHLPAGCTMPKVRRAIEARHPNLAPLLRTNVGFVLMHQESQILIKVLQSLNKKGVVGLGLHDAVMVPLSQATRTKDIMETCSMEVSGKAIPVEIKFHS